jgi:hypothetical protein
MSDSTDQDIVEKAVMGLKEAELASRSGLPPVDKWHPERRHSIDMRIARDGSWHYQGSEISRAKLVKLFASILIREDDGSYHLVTPVEQARITVEDVPFVAVAMHQAGEGTQQTLAFTTSVGDVVVAGLDHGLRFELDPQTDEPAPYVHIRGEGTRALEARINRAVYYDLVDLGTTHAVDGENWFGVWSGNVFFKMQRAAELGVE